MIARTIFALLLLKHGIIHMDVVEHRGQIFMSQQLLETKGIVTLDEVVHGKGVPQDVRADAFVCNACTRFESLEEHLHAIFGQGLARFGEKDMILSSASPIRELLGVGTMFVQIIEEVALTVLAQRDTSLL